MTGMQLPETKSYLAHHLGLAGRSDTLFSDDAIALIHQVSRGLPRAVNNLAVQALVAAFAANKTIVDENSAPEPPSPRSRPNDHHPDTLTTRPRQHHRRGLPHGAATSSTSTSRP